jgi:hypothetical protein
MITKSMRKFINQTSLASIAEKDSSSSGTSLLILGLILEKSPLLAFSARDLSVRR